MEMLNDLYIVMVFFCLFFFGLAILTILRDIVMTIWHQARGKEYRMETVDFLEKKREWWKWLIMIVVMILGIYALLPHPWMEKADFRADYEREEYTAYYACSYLFDGPDARLIGDGIVEVQKFGDSLCARALYTDYGRVTLGFWMDKDDEDHSRATGYLRDEWDVELEIGDIMPDTNFAALNQQEYLYYEMGCMYCKNVVDPKYIYTTDWSEQVCPVCVYAWFDAENEWGVWKCGRCNTFYEGSETEFSPCPDCEQP